MSEKIIESNKVTISGEITSDFTFCHELFGEKFYIAYLSVMRKGGTADIIPVMVSDRLISVSNEWAGKKVSVNGQFRSFNQQNGERWKCILYVFAREFEVKESAYDDNHIFLDGYICKEPVYRETPLGREIADILLAVNRPYGKSDYIPCICWGRNARFSAGLEVGEHIRIEGRLQSREYQKKISEEEAETRTAYEVSVKKIIVLETTEDANA